MNFFRFLFLDAHREVLSLLTGEMTEESDQFRFLWTVRLGNLKGFVDSIRQVMRVTWSSIPLPRFFHSRRVPPLLIPSLVLFPQRSA